MPAATSERHARCCIVGGGPAGMMLGLLLARSGIETIVLEKHADFLRDFRGDTVHPSTLELMYELGALEDFLRRPHQELRRATGYFGATPLVVADFSHVPTHCKFVALMPQWDFLDFLAERARRYPTFELRMRTEVTDLLEAGGRVVGVRATAPDGALDIRADLVVGTDGRHSTVRERARLVVEDFGAPMDVLWMRVPRRPDDPGQLMFRFDPGRAFVMIDRGDYWQCGYIIPKGDFDEVRRRGLETLQDAIAELAPFLRDRTAELRSWDDIRLLTVKVDRLRRWYRDGLLCIGDAAHAMSPVGGVGINLAVQDAVAAANILAGPLRAGSVTTADLQKVQRRRELPTRITQRLQLLIQNRIIRRTLASRGPLTLPLPLRLVQRFPILRRVPGHVIGVGFRPEHVRMPEQYC